ncbi:hypothetical protein Ae201684P_018785 [Aphanomyces euteiches]|nr:hypothetical protein Ae201684P_018785 [Aphanomyces euteiches]KAH9133534.1 hypothetical protein AeRB84_020405 [Aphanomyces euteiches]
MFVSEHLSDAVFCVENNNYAASKKGKSNGNHENDNQGHAIDNSEPGKQAERNEVQESASTRAYGMAVDDDTLKQSNMNDEAAMKKAKKAEYNKRAREKKRHALLEEVNKSKKAEYKNRAREKKRHAIVEDFFEKVAVKRSKKAEYNKRAREKKRNTEVANQGRDAIVLHHTDMDQSNEEESKEGEDGRRRIPLPRSK